MDEMVEIEYDAQDMEFPVKNRKRAIRRKNAVRHGKRRMRLRDAIMGSGNGVDWDDEAYIRCYNVVQCTSVFYNAESKSRAHRNQIHSWPSVWCDEEELAPIGTRRRTEAMDLAEKDYLHESEDEVREFLYLHDQFQMNAESRKIWDEYQAETEAENAYSANAA